MATCAVPKGSWRSVCVPAAAAGLGSFIVKGRRADEQFAAALSPFLSAEELAQRPRTVRAGAVAPVRSVAPGRRTVQRNVQFTPPDHPKRLALDVYEPTEPPAPGQRRPAIIQIHGGAWTIGDKREQGIPLLNHLAANGWVGFNVNYRLSPRAKAPDHLVDCKLALAWVREHADEYGIDPEFVAVTGGSAGGHLTAMMALTANDPEYQPGFESADTTVQAAVPFYGVYDLVDEPNHMWPGFFNEFLEPGVMKTTRQQDRAAFERYSPKYRVHADAPPTLVIHGSDDVLVPVEMGRDFVEALRATSNSAVAYAELEGAQHAFDIFPSPRTVETVEYVERFLNGVLQGAIK